MLTADLLDEFYTHLGVTQEEFNGATNDDKALLQLNRAYWELLDKFPFREKETTASFSSVIGQRNYEVPSPFEALRQLSILEPSNNNWKTLDRAVIFEHENIKSDEVSDRGFPVKYVREKDLIRLYPVPDQVYSLVIKYWTVLNDLDTSGNNPEMPKSWYEIILYGGIWRGFLSLKDFEASDRFKTQQLALLNSAVPVEAKEETDSHRSGVEVMRSEKNW